MMKENKLRRILEENGRSISTRISSRWATITELATCSGCYDYIEYLAEYSPLTNEDYENLARVCELHGMGSIVKVLDTTKNKEITYSIVGSNEVNALEHKISDVSPVGAALMSKHKGDEVEVETANGVRVLKILDVTRR